ESAESHGEGRAGCAVRLALRRAGSGGRGVRRPFPGILAERFSARFSAAIPRIVNRALFVEALFVVLGFVDRFASLLQGVCLGEIHGGKLFVAVIERLDSSRVLDQSVGALPLVMELLMKLHFDFDAF